MNTIASLPEPTQTLARAIAYFALQDRPIEPEAAVALMIVGGSVRAGMPDDEFAPAMQEGAAALEAGDVAEADVEFALSVVMQVVAGIGASGEDELRRIAESN